MGMVMSYSVYTDTVQAISFELTPDFYFFLNCLNRPKPVVFMGRRFKWILPVVQGILI